MKKIALSLVGLTALFAAACGPVQSDACKKMIDCEEDYSTALDTTATDWSGSYGPEGSCWASTQEGADACTAACEKTIETYKTSIEGVDGADVGACG